MKLFKYVIQDRIDILLNQSIRFTPSGELNDPFESLPFVSRIMDPSDSQYLFNTLVPSALGDHWEKPVLENVDEEIINTIPPEYRKPLDNMTLRDAFSHNESIIKQIFDLFLTANWKSTNLDFSALIKKEWEKRFVVLSMSSNPSNIPMWTHYANDHKGFLIEFNHEHTFFQVNRFDGDPFQGVCQVKYTPTRPEIKLFNKNFPEQDALDFYYEKILLTKSLDWEYEQELRLVCEKWRQDFRPKIDNGKEILLRSFDTTLIKSIYVGVNTPESVKTMLSDILKEKRYQHVNYFEGSLDPSEYRINFKQL